MTSTRLPTARQDGREAVHAVMLALACAITYWLSTRLLDLMPSLGRSNNILGGMWAVIATVFVYREARTQDITNALSRMSATLVSFVLCEAYLLLLPFNAVGLGVLIGAGALILTALGRPGDAVTAGITTTVVMVVAHLSPEHTWQQPILRIIDTIVGAAVALAAGWLSTHLLLRWSQQHTLGSPTVSGIGTRRHRQVLDRPLPVHRVGTGHVWYGNGAAVVAEPCPAAAPVLDGTPP